MSIVLNGGGKMSKLIDVRDLEFFKQQQDVFNKNKFALQADVKTLVTTYDIDQMFAGTYTSSTTKYVDDTAINYTIEKIKEL